MAQTKPGPSKAAKAASSPKTFFGVRSSSSSSRAKAASPQPLLREPSPKKARHGVVQFVAAYRELPGFCQALYAGTIIVGNGRSVLGLKH